MYAAACMWWLLTAVTAAPVGLTPLGVLLMCCVCLVLSCAVLDAHRSSTGAVVPAMDCLHVLSVLCSTCVRCNQTELGWPGWLCYVCHGMPASRLSILAWAPSSAFQNVFFFFFENSSHSSIYHAEPSWMEA